MKLIESIKQIISEASKKQILLDKIGFNEENANVLDTVCGPLAIWMAKKVMEFQQNIELGWGKPASQGQALIDKMNSNRFITGHRGKIQSIMDWIRIGLNGNVKEYQNLPISLYSNFIDTVQNERAIFPTVESIDDILTRAFFIQRGTKSAIVYPILKGVELIGIVGFEWTHKVEKNIEQSYVQYKQGGKVIGETLSKLL